MLKSKASLVMSLAISFPLSDLDDNGQTGCDN